ncbi:MAG: pirin family protein, partial [Pseudomonadota bacterium]|nr:pirin family protein [Pseudomonadota bacterium]
MDELFTAASARGQVRHRALTSFRSFNDPARNGFGALRALNEEVLAPGAAIPLHAHENVEIVSLPLAGCLRHQDSRGASHVIEPGDVHLLSAGRGITHWEHNHSAHASAHYLQLWIHPRAAFTPARYEQGRIDAVLTENRFLCLAAPMGGLVRLDQQAWISLARIESGM